MTELKTLNDIEYVCDTGKFGIDDNITDALRQEAIKHLKIQIEYMANRSVDAYSIFKMWQEFFNSTEEELK